MAYTQLTREQRYQIYILRKAGHSQNFIAKEIGVHPATISRELQRGCGLRGYRPKQAEDLAGVRKQKRYRPRIAATTWALIEQLLRQDWSPEQVSGWLAKEKQLQVSHERIYQYIYADKARGGTLFKHLRCRKLRPALLFYDSEALPTAAQSRSARRSLSSGSESVTGRLIRSLVRTIGKPFSAWSSASQSCAYSRRSSATRLKRSSTLSKSCCYQWRQRSIPSPVTTGASLQTTRAWRRN